MSGTRLTRKVTVEGSKKLPESGGQSSGSSSGTRRSVFERLGPGTSDRERPRSREPYPPPEKCRNWLRDGRCQFGRNCKFLHGPFSEPKQRTKSMRSIVRSDVDRSEERDEGGMGGRTRSMDSLEAEDEDEREIPIKKKKSRHFEESGDTGKKSDKLKRRQHAEKASSSRSEDEEEEEDEHRKRRKKLKKRQLSGGVVITKPRNPEQEERDWGDEENEERRNELDWEERGELDFERQLNLEKRRQDLQRQLALMDEEEAEREIDDRKVKEPKKDRDEEHKPVIPVVHSKLHPEKSSVSPGDEFSPVSSQSTPKKKKKKTDGEPKKVKIKHKLSPAAKELKKRKGIKLHVAAEGLEAGTVQDRTRKLMLSPEASKLNILPEKREFEVDVGEKSRAVKKKQLKTKLKEGNILKGPEDAYLSPSDLSGRRPQRTSYAEEIPRDKSLFSPEEQRPPVEKVRRRAALSSPEGSDSPSLRYPSEPDRNRRIADPSEGSPRKHLRDIHVVGPPGESDYKPKVKGYNKRYKLEGSPGTPEQGRREVVKDMRHVEEGQVERRKIIVDEPPPRSPSPEDIPARGLITPPEEQRRRRTPPGVDRRGPQTPPGEPEYDNDAVKHAASDRATSRQLGPYTPPPPPPPTPPVRTRVDKNREEIYEGRPESVPCRDDLPRNKERGERETRYPKPRGVEGGDEPSRGGRGHPPTDEDFTKSRVRDEELSRGRHRDDRQEDHHQRGRPKDDRADEFHRVGEQPERSRLDEPKGDEFPRRKGEGDDEYLRRRDERDDDHFRGRNREPDKDDERQRRRDERNDEHPRGRVRDEHEEDLQKPRGRDIPRRQLEGGDDRHWEGRADRDSREAGQFTDRGDRRRTDIPPRQDMPDNRSRERPDERPRDREGRHPPPGPDYHRRTSPIPHGPRRSPPPHGPPRGPHRFMERRRSLSPGGRREEGYRPGPPRDQGGYGIGREPVRGRGGYTVPFDNRGRPMDDGRRRNSPPPRQYMERGRGAPRGRGGRVGRGFPDRMRPPGDRYQEPPRDRGAPWDPERRREREHPRDRSRPHDESRDRDRRPRGELSPGRGPRHWEEKKSGSPGRGSSPPRDRRAHEQEKMPREVEEDRRRRSDDEEEEWEYEEDMGEEKDKVPRQRERKRARETTSSVSTIESPVGGKRRRSETPEMEEAAIPDAVEHGDKASTGTPTRQAPTSTGTPTKQAPTSTGTPTKQAPASSGTPTKQSTKIKKKKVSKKEGKIPKPEGVASLEGQMPQETALESEGQLEGERQPKGEKKHKKDKGKSKEKSTKKKKKNSTASAEEIEVATELSEEPTNVHEEGGAVPSEHVGEVAQPAVDEPMTKLGKKRRHADVPEGEEIKTKGADKPPKKKKKKKHQPEVVVQPWADLEGEDDERNTNKSENNERQESDKDVQPVQGKESEERKSSDGVTDENQDSSKVDEPLTVFSDWSDDSPIGDDSWSDINEPEIAEDKPKAEDKERDNVQAASPVENSAPAYDDVYDPISDDELDAMLGDEEEEDGAGSSGATGLVSAPMAVEDVDWSALVSTPGAAEKTGEEPGSYLKRFTPGHVFSRIGISSSLAGPRLTKLVQQACAKATNDNLSGVETVDSNDVKGMSGLQVRNSIGALMAGAAAKRRERQMLFTDVGPCRRALCARKDLAMRKRLQRLTGKVGLFQTPPTAPVDNELYLMSVALYKHEHTSTDSSVTKLIPSRVGTVLTTVNS